MPAEAVSHVKDPRYVEAGRRGGLKRWGGRRIVRLDSLQPTVRAAVVALVAADAAARTKMTAPDVSETSSEAVKSEVRHDRAAND